MSQPDNTYDAVALIKHVYGKITFSKTDPQNPELGFLQINETTGFITLKDPDPPLDKFPSVSELKGQIKELELAIDAITAKKTILLKANGEYPWKGSIQNRITHVKKEMENDGQRTNYAAHAYVLNCLLHVQALLNERIFKATYLETIEAARKAGAALFY
jgi:hypothetical protein